MLNNLQEQKAIPVVIVALGVVVLVLGFVDLYSHAVPAGELPHTHDRGETYSH